MNAVFAPIRGLANAASICGVKGFNWQQTVDVWPSPSDLFRDVDPFGQPLIAPPRFLDPVPGGYSYLPTNAFPFYYSLNPEDPWALADHTNGDANICFLDTPANDLLEDDGFMEFTTYLVGVLPNGGVGPRLFEWRWRDTFNGTSGGISRVSNGLPADPLSGSGGITILSINGIPVTDDVPVPAPSALLLFVAGLVGLLFVRLVRRTSDHWA
jgi:hypothetical protein